MNYYDILEVAPDASYEVIRASYKALSKKYHPDNYGDNGEMMRKINEAFDILSDSKKRSAYDIKEKNINTNEENHCNTHNKTERKNSFVEKITSFIFSGICLLFYGIFYVLQFAWGIILLLLIIGFFTGHSQELFMKLLDWIFSLVDRIPFV